ncbi:MAG: Gfo/Idh/MocA family protein [Bacteroidales bacterium]
MHNKLISRRKFMTTSAMATGALIIKPQLIRGTKANSAIRIGLLGCGNRGTRVATAFVNSSRHHSRIVAIADLFDDRLQAARKNWDDIAVKKGYSAIDMRNVFKGAESFRMISECKDVDMIIISSPDYFHPQHLEAVVEAGKHCYCEKPAGVDVESCMKFIETGERATGRLSLDIGFNVRSAPCFFEVVNRIHNGAIGEVSYGALHYHASAISYPEYPNASPLERRIRRFYWDRILSGDTIVDQHIHVIDIANWVLKAHPIKAVGTGGRKARKDGSDIFDNWSVSFTYPGNVNVNLSAVQFGSFWDVGVRFIGDQGVGESNYNGNGRITGKQPWSSEDMIKSGDFSTAGDFKGLGNCDERKAELFLDSIVSGNYHNEAREGAESALSAIMGRMAAYSGEEVTWNEMLGSNQSYQGQIDLKKI